MLDIKFVRENPDAVKENIKKKFQDAKLPLVDEVIEKDAQYRAALKEVEALKAARNKLSKANGPLFGQLKKCDDEPRRPSCRLRSTPTTPPSRPMPTRWQSWRRKRKLCLPASRRSCTPSPR